MLIGYIGADRAKARQRAALRAAGVEDGDIYQGQDGLDACLRAVGPGDTLAVWRVGQLGRNLRDRVHIVDRLTANGATLRVLAGRRAEDDGPLMSGVFAALAEFERDLDLERAKARIRPMDTPERASARQ